MADDNLEANLCAALATFIDARKDETPAAVVENELAAALTAHPHIAENAALPHPPAGQPPIATSFSPSDPIPSSAPPSVPPPPDTSDIAAALAASLSQHSPSLKRAAEDDPLGHAHDAKRPRADGNDHSVAVKPEPELGLSMDIEAMLQSALASYDGKPSHPPPEAANHEPAPISPETVRAPSPSVRPGTDSVVNNIWKASTTSNAMLRHMSLSVLGNLAVQLLIRLLQQSRTETETLLADETSDFRKDYEALMGIFLQSRNIFSSSPLISPAELGVADPDASDTVRMANLASIAASIFGSHDVHLADVHDSFSFIFDDPEFTGCSSSLADLLVSLKTQIFMDRMVEPMEPDYATSQIDQLFPPDFAESTEKQELPKGLENVFGLFVQRVGERRAELLKVVCGVERKGELKNMYPSNLFADTFCTFLDGCLAMVVEYADRCGVNLPLTKDETAPQNQGMDLASFLASGLAQDGLLGVDGVYANMAGASIDDSSLPGHAATRNDAMLSHTPSGIATGSSGEGDLASLIQAQLADSLVDKVPHGLPSLAQHYGAPASQGVTYPQHGMPGSSVNAVDRDGDMLPPNQSTSTAVLYERARQAAAAKNTNPSRREGLHSARRPWSDEEEKALMMGLDMVKGPHWSQILTLFGPRGTMSTVLKDRSQVQLKDKARNLKLFFLKTGSEMPFYLQNVTGELKTRAPGQAARKEAEEKARQSREEEQARLQGIGILADGLQNHRHSSNNRPLANSAPAAAGPPVPLHGLPTAQLSSAPGQANGTAMSSAPISPVVKSEAMEHHSHHQHTKFPQIQPAPAPGVVTKLAPAAPLHDHQKSQSAPAPSQHHQGYSPYQPTLLPAPPPTAATATAPQGQAQGQAPRSQPGIPASTPSHQHHGLPPMPPNHHSAPDPIQEAQVKDEHLFAVLQAAVQEGEGASQNYPPTQHYPPAGSG